ncbi:hypothetical protein [Mycolicibacterium goodii]|uniref:hypothetical protein n=1 Tax=Mycolicibacterium goodii TaxID=134601 RepID=UPI001BDD75A6|nr:hypothetical protein [Mycolicibacterium goodii]MBU8830861.1 hypothetical protein [Mycolicibacterium goodii]
MSDYPTLAEVIRAMPSPIAAEEYPDEPGFRLSCASWDNIADRIAVEWVKSRTIETAEQLDALPRGVVVRSAAGTLWCRFDQTRGVVFGDHRPFPWARLALPARVLYTPGVDQ